VIVGVSWRALLDSAVDQIQIIGLPFDVP